MTIWSSIWLFLIASLLICHYTLIISYSLVCVYTCSLSVGSVCAQTSELTEKQIKISPGPVPSSSFCLTRRVFASFSFITFLFMFPFCLLISFFQFFPSEDFFSFSQDIRVLHKISVYRCQKPVEINERCNICQWSFVSGLMLHCKLIHPKCFRGVKHFSKFTFILRGRLEEKKMTLVMKSK